MLLCRSGSTFFFPVTVLLILGDFLHVALIFFFMSARYLWNRQIDFIEKAGGLFRRGQLPLVLNLDECCYYYRFHLLSIKYEKDLGKALLDHVSSCTKAAKRFFDTVFSSFSICLWKYGSAIRLWAECNLQGTSIQPTVFSSEETRFGYLNVTCFPTSWMLFSATVYGQAFKTSAIVFLHAYRALDELVFSYRIFDLLRITV